MGFLWEPTERTNIAVSGGQRFFGNTYSAVASHRTRLTAWDFSYSQNITTFNQQAGAGMGLGFPGGFGGSLNSLGGPESQSRPRRSPASQHRDSRPRAVRVFF